MAPLKTATDISMQLDRRVKYRYVRKVNTSISLEFTENIKSPFH